MATKTSRICLAAAEGCILVDFLSRKETVITVRYVQTLQKLRRALCDKTPMKRRIILRHDNARPHTAHLTYGKTGKFSWEVLLHPP
jgi:hypothetical protein